jgi:hypothetical protein
MNLNQNYDKVKNLCRTFSILLFLLVANSFSVESQTAVKTVECEKVNKFVSITLGFIQTCFMNNKTLIDSDGLQISSKDETVKGLCMNENKKIEFLPEATNGAFPNLLSYSAYECSIKNISHKNFQSLMKLRELFLSHNQIETIRSNTFKDLISLEKLSLGKNTSSLFMKILIFCSYLRWQQN